MADEKKKSKRVTFREIKELYKKYSDDTYKPPEGTGKIRSRRRDTGRKDSMGRPIYEWRTNEPRSAYEHRMNWRMNEADPFHNSDDEWDHDDEAREMVAPNGIFNAMAEKAFIGSKRRRKNPIQYIRVGEGTNRNMLIHMNSVMGKSLFYEVSQDAKESTPSGMVRVTVYEGGADDMPDEDKVVEVAEMRPEDLDLFIDEQAEEYHYTRGVKQMLKNVVSGNAKAVKTLVGLAGGGGVVLSGAASMFFRGGRRGRFPGARLFSFGRRGARSRSRSRSVGLFKPVEKGVTKAVNSLFPF